MARKDISDLQVLQAYEKARKVRDYDNLIWPEMILMEETGQCEKVCFSAMYRSADRGLIDYGVSLRAGWITEKGKNLLDNQKI